MSFVYRFCCFWRTRAADIYFTNSVSVLLRKKLIQMREKINSTGTGNIFYTGALGMTKM
jgi:hypothetical protein